MLSIIDALIRSPRMKLLAMGLLAVNLLVTLGWLLTLHGLMNAFHQPVGGDFILYYATSKLTLLGHASDAFNPLKLLAVERSVIPMVPPGLNWSYPPTNQLLVAPLAILPFVWSYLAFLTITFIPFVFLMRRLGGASPWVLVLVGAFPGTFANVFDGQNGFLTAALMGWGLLLVERRPWLGGVLLGCLIYKPQFGLILPVVLVATGNWRAITGAAISAGALIALSAGVFGGEAWLAFFRTLPQASSNFSQGGLAWGNMPSITAGLLSAGVSASVAGVVQGVVALGASIAAWACWRRPAPHLLKMGIAVLACFLISPYSFNYDLVLLAVPIAALAVELRRADDSAVRGAGLVMILLALLPTLLTAMTYIHASSLIILGCFAALVSFTWRRSTPSLVQDPLKPSVGAADVYPYIARTHPQT